MIVISEAIASLSTGVRPRTIVQRGITMQLERKVSPADLADMEADAIICAVGSRPYLPHVEGVEHPRVMPVDELFGGKAREVGKRVIVFDFFGDWPGMESGIFLAEKGHDVTLVSARLYIGEQVHQYLRNEYLKKLYQLKARLVPHVDFGGIRDERVMMRNLFSYEIEQTVNWDTVVLSLGRIPNIELYEQTKGLAPYVRQIGDSLAPRTLEEATYEGFMAALEI